MESQSDLLTHVVLLSDSQNSEANLSMKRLELNLTDAGYLVSTIGPVSGYFDLGAAVEQVRTLVVDKVTNNTRLVLIGTSLSADALAKGFYRFYSVCKPMALILLSPRVLPIHLNNITCPYLVLHGDCEEWLLTHPYERIEQAVMHHQIRYGDLTTSYRVPGTARLMAGVSEVEDRVTAKITHWLRGVGVEHMRHHQEPAA